MERLEELSPNEIIGDDIKLKLELERIRLLSESTRGYQSEKSRSIFRRIIDGVYQIVDSFYHVAGW